MKINPYVYPGLKFDFIPSLKKRDKRKNVTIDSIIKIVAENCEVTVEDILSRKRHQPIVEARHILCGILRNEFEKSYMDISRVVNRKEHTSSIHSVRYYNRKYYKKDIYKKLVDNIINEIDSKT